MSKLKKTGVLTAATEKINENLVLNSDIIVNSNTYKLYNLSQTIPSGTKITISCRIDADNIVLTGNKRAGLSMDIPKSDGSGTQYFETWASYANGLLSDNGSYHGRISNTGYIYGNVSRIGAYIQTLSSGTIEVSQIKVEIGDHATTWILNSSECNSGQGFIEGSNIARIFKEHVEANQFIEW